MPRKKFRNSQRHISTADRSYQEYLLDQSAPLSNKTELIRLIRGGEDTYLELKLKLSNPERIAQEIVALANTGGGTMVFGVTDLLRIEGVRNPESVQEELGRLCREEIYPPILPLIDIVAFDNGRRIVALEISGKDKPYRTKEGKFYVRLGAEKLEADREVLSNLIKEARPLRYENIPLPEFDAEDFDDTLLWSFAREFEENGSNGDQYNTERFLKKDLLLAIGNGDDFVPTVAGVMLFGKNPSIETKFASSRVTLRRFAGTDPDSPLVEEKTVSGNLISLHEAAMAFISKYCDLEKHKSARSSDPDPPVEARSRYHVYSIVEAVSNLLIHRDMALMDLPSEINVFDGSIEFVNPRRTAGFAPPASKAVRLGITQRLNPQIASVFLRREYGVKLPQGGLPMILKQSRLFSGRKVDLQTTGDLFKLKIYGVN
ncbi:MAG: putative DNA binding domain-containing protein [Acidobacteriota bacterium]|nr:MAG: putative DNA binding domain-containing protein [Acidobacteriota bacterium]